MLIFMKIWLKCLIGAALGTLLAFAIPQNAVSIRNIIEFCSTITVRIGRYMVVPLVFTGGVSAVFVLRDSKMLFKSVAAVIAAIVAFSLLLTLVGILSVLVVKLPRIPITVERITNSPVLNVKTMIESIFPYSPIEAFLSESFLLPVFALAVLFGAACVSDKSKSKPFIALTDSVSNISYIIQSFITDIMPIGMIAVAFSRASQFFGMVSSRVLAPLIIMLTADFLLVVCLVYPLIFYLLCRGHYPFRPLYASLAPMIAAFFSGDTNYALPFQIRHGTESLGIRRRINGLAFPLFSIFSRGGSALVVSVSFIVILRSYSPLAIRIEDIAWIAATSFGVSFLLCAKSSGGAFIELAVLCGMYGRGFETVYLLLSPAAAVVCAYAAAIDAATVMFGSYLVSFKLKMTEQRDLRHFI
jgi:Na+/H+-dicarboxylate symporter